MNHINPVVHAGSTGRRSYSIDSKVQKSTLDGLLAINEDLDAFFSKGEYPTNGPSGNSLEIANSPRFKGNLKTRMNALQIHDSMPLNHSFSPRIISIASSFPVSSFSAEYISFTELRTILE